MPDHGREPCLPCESGKKQRRRIQKVRRFSRAAVFKVERTSTTSHPCAVKNPGPSSGANLNSAFPSLICSPMPFCSIFSKPGDTISMIQRGKGHPAARSGAGDATSSRERGEKPIPQGGVALQVSGQRRKVLCSWV